MYVVDEIFAPDYVAPSEPTLPNTGEFKICWAMLDLGWQDLNRRAWRDRKDRLDAMQWFLSTIDHEHSFRNVCAVLRIDADAVIERLCKKRLLNHDVFARRVAIETEEEWNGKAKSIQRVK